MLYGRQWIDDTGYYPVSFRDENASMTCVATDVSDRRQRDGKSRPLAFTGALRAHRAAVKFDDVSHDGQPQPQPAVFAIGGLALLAEAIEDMRKKVRADTLPIIAHCDLDLRVCARQPQPDISTNRCELNGVCKQIPDSLL